VGHTFTGYVSPNGTTWTQVGSRHVVMPAEVYGGFAGTSHNAGARTTIAFDQADATETATPPPAAWAQRNWGTATGSFTAGPTADAVASITATSGDIYGASDSGVFIHRPVTGPVTLITRVTAVGNSNGWAKAGLMIRDGLEPNVANAFVALTPAAGAVFQSRPATPGAQTTTLAHNWSPRPGALLKLVRGGGTITASFSTNNGTTWTPLGSITDDFPPTIHFGYAASSHNPSASTTATFAQPE
jgi:hypothetical protein